MSDLNVNFFISIVFAAEGVTVASPLNIIIVLYYYFCKCREMIYNAWRCESIQISEFYLILILLMMSKHVHHEKHLVQVCA